MKKFIFAVALLCTSFSLGIAQSEIISLENTVFPGVNETKAVIPTVGPVMCEQSPTEKGINYTFYVPIEGVNPTSLKYVWKVTPNDVILNHTYTNEIGVTFNKSGYHLVWVDVYYDGGMVSASMNVWIM